MELDKEEQKLFELQAIKDSEMTQLEQNNYKKVKLKCCKTCAYGELHDDGCTRLDPDWYDCCLLYSYVSWDGVCDRYSTERGQHA